MVSIFQTCSATGKSVEQDGTLGMDQAVPFLKKAAELPGKGPLATAMMLIALNNRLNRVEHILLIPKTLSEFGLSRTTAYRSLVQLELLGLVTIRRHKGQGPLVSFVKPAIAEIQDEKIAHVLGPS